VNSHIYRHSRFPEEAKPVRFKRPYEMAGAAFELMPPTLIVSVDDMKGKKGGFVGLLLS
jgi:hypothetical protein